MPNTIRSASLPPCFVNMVDCIVHAEGKSALTPRAPCPSPQSQDSVPHSSIPGIHAGLSPEFLIELAGLAVVRSLGSAVVVQGSHCQVVHVEPDGSPPVWGVVLCVPLIGEGTLLAYQKIASYPSLLSFLYCNHGKNH